MADLQLSATKLARRRHWTFPARSVKARLRRAVHGGLEQLLCWFSIHGDQPVYARRQFPWIPGVEAGWRPVRQELDAVMEHRAAMPNFQDILREVGAIQKDDQWKTFFLKGVGMDCSENARRCPETMKVLASIPGCTTAFFSILSPHKHIPPHRGAWAGVLRLHLALVVPEPADQCRIRIADEVHTWREGRCLVFDDTYNHQVWNDTDGYRVVLFVDFERPLRWPLSALNHWLLSLAGLAPFLREANARQQAAERSFWQRVTGITPS
jgi:beta-hydroxylase